MKKMLGFGTIVIMILAVLLTGCNDTVGKATNAVKKEINANSCNADASCEALLIDADSGKFRDAQFQTVGISEQIIVGNYLQAQTATIQDKLSVLKDASITNTLTANLINADSGKFRDAQFQTVGISEEVIVGNKMQAQKVVILDSAQVIALKGTGNAYACLDKTGKLFRSTTPCK